MGLTPGEIMMNARARMQVGHLTVARMGGRPLVVNVVNDSEASGSGSRVEDLPAYEAPPPYEERDSSPEV